MAITEEDRKRTGTMSPELVEELQRHPALSFSPDEQQRHRRSEYLSKLRHLYPIPGRIPDQVTEATHHVEARDGFKIPIKIYKPVKLSTSGAPVYIAIHEGGWSMGDLTDEDLNCRILLPEKEWPAPVDDCWDVVRWVAKTANPSNPTLPGDPKTGFVVGGAPAGGHISAVMTQLARDTSLNPPLTGLYLAMPVLLWHDVVPEKWKSEYRSRMESINDPIFKDAYHRFPMDSPAGRGVSDPIMNPLLHPNLNGLPPCYMQVAGLDPLRDEALIWERVLREENEVATKIDIYDGYGHMFHANWPLLERSKDFHRDTLEGMRWLLGRK